MSKLCFGGGLNISFFMFTFRRVALYCYTFEKESVLRLISVAM